MSPNNHLGSILPQDIGYDAADQPGLAQPFSLAEIEDLLYGDDRPAAERVQRLREIRDELAARESADFGDDDPGALIGEIDQAIARLEVSSEDADADEYPALGPALFSDPHDHRETMSPDDEEREELEEEDEASVEEDEGVLDPKEWDEDQDGFDPDRGVR